MKRLFSLATLASLLVPSVVFAADTTRPTIGGVSPGTATAGVAVTLSAFVSDAESGVASCNLYVDSDDRGSMTVSSGQATKSYVFPYAQVYTVFVFCRDAAGNFNSGPNTSVWAQAATGGGDTSSPTVGAASPMFATAGTSVTFSATVSDTGTGVSSCTLFVGGTDQGVMTLADGVASKAYTFASPGTSSVYVRCVDGAGNSGVGLNVAVTVASGAASGTPPTSGPKPGSLLKLECPASAAADHPCKAVYYFGKDGMRHAFPNDKTYFTWYVDFSGVTTASADALTSIPLGKNVTYRPGVKMVKFTTSQVYAVAKGGVLRWVKTEADALTLYDTDWNKKIDDISDAFYANYRYGADITNTNPYNLTAELQGAATIDDTL